MNFREPFIERAICEIRYSATLGYFEKRLPLCREIMQKKSELRIWNVGTPQIQLRDESIESDSRRIFSVNFNRCNFIFRNPGVYENFQALSSYLMLQTMAALQIDTLTRMGVRLFYFVGVKERFTELKDSLMSRFFTVEIRKQLGEPAGIKDFAVTFELKKGKYDFNVRIGALSPEEIEGTVYKGEKFYVPKKQRSTSVLIDVDLYKRDCSRKELTEILKHTKTDTMDVVKKILFLSEEKK